MMNKKGAVLPYVYVGVLFALLIVALVFVSWGSIQETFGPEEPIKDGEPLPPAKLPNLGDPAYIKTNAIDEEYTTSVRYVALPVYTKDTSNGVVTSTTLTSSATTTNVDTSIGSHYDLIAFNKTYYGDWEKNFYVTASKPLDLGVHKIATGAKFTPFTEDDVAFATDAQNFSLGSSAVYTLTKIKVKINGTDELLRLKEMYFNTLASTNISEIKFTSETLKSIRSPKGNLDVKVKPTNNVPQRLRTASNPPEYYYALDEYLELDEYDYFLTPSVQVKADADGCSAVGADDIIFGIVDEQNFQSLKPTTFKEILSGTENDADTPADVGGSDLSYTINCGP